MAQWNVDEQLYRMEDRTTLSCYDSKTNVLVMQWHLELPSFPGPSIATRSRDNILYDYWFSDSLYLITYELLEDGRTKVLQCRQFHYDSFHSVVHGIDKDYVVSCPEGKVVLLTIQGDIVESYPRTTPPTRNSSLSWSDGELNYLMYPNAQVVCLLENS